MTNSENTPKASRPGEYVAFFTIELPTLEGPAFVFIGCDADSEFAFHTGVEGNNDPETLIKHIGLLMENRDFLHHRDKGFTLVLEKGEALSDQIERIIEPVNGRLLYDKAFHTRIAKPVLESLGGFSTQ